MTTTLIFDADGTLYDETMPKAKAEQIGRASCRERV